MEPAYVAIADTMNNSRYDMLLARIMLLRKEENQLYGTLDVHNVQSIQAVCSIIQQELIKIIHFVFNERKIATIVEPIDLTLVTKYIQYPCTLRDTILAMLVMHNHLYRNMDLLISVVNFINAVNHVLLVKEIYFRSPVVLTDNILMATECLANETVDIDGLVASLIKETYSL